MAPRAAAIAAMLASGKYHDGAANAAEASVAMSSCGPLGRVLIDDIALTPIILRTDTDVTVNVSGHVAMGEAAFDAEKLRVHSDVIFCPSPSDCMAVHGQDFLFCDLFGDERNTCLHLRNGDIFKLSVQRHIPLEILHGSFGVKLLLAYGDDPAPACYDSPAMQVFAKEFRNQCKDLFDAIISFVIAASASRFVGGLVPALSCDIVPRLTGYLFVGILVGPYCCNLVTDLHIGLIGGFINNVAVAFISGAAGAEIFLPELKPFLCPIFVQVIFLTVGAMTVVTIGVLTLTGTGFASIPGVSEQSTAGARLALTAVISCLMATGSPASVISLVSELGCQERISSKFTLGITVLTETTALVVFAVCTKWAQVATSDTGFDATVICTVLLELLGSVAFGALAGQIIRAVLPRGDPESDEGNRDMVGLNAKELAQSGNDPEGTATGTLSKSKGCFSMHQHEILAAALGLVVLLVLTGTFLVANSIAAWTKGAYKLEPILVCTVASCVAGQDVQRRSSLVDGLAFWTQSVVLPYFTLAGASLQLPSLAADFKVVLIIATLRIIGIAVGSIVAGFLIAKVWPQVGLTSTAVWLTFTTLLAQAGVTLGLIMEVQTGFQGWGGRLATLLIGIVVVNQIIGPILCRVGFTIIFNAEDAQSDMHLPTSSASETELSTLQQPTSPSVFYRSASSRSFGGANAVDF
eukprot:TRINITY_DN37628_c0_g1_i1.p1 TRINITY_DN37628_c0_g1~~TRINITY_DN37628_c0_g1_i1.p1  ORF type:complete len:694 (-),score=99.97 TRINITY_DN37628_c0_g1_i1:42-2123(-)